jgi:hypothetical protein
MTMVTGPTASLATAPKQDQRYVGLCAAKALGYLSLRHRSAESSDLGNLIVGQKLLEHRDQTDVDSVLFVEPIVCPFEIGDDVVGFDSINVVDHRKVGWIWNESEPYKSVDVDGFALTFAEEIELAIPKFIDAMLQHLAVASLRTTRSHTHSIEASYPTKAADLVEVSEVCDRNRSPFFCESDIHTTGCPSGNGGTMIKDPSRASTFGGSAIMALASDTYNGRLQFR